MDEREYRTTDAQDAPGTVTPAKSLPDYHPSRCSPLEFFDHTMAEGLHLPQPASRKLVALVNVCEIYVQQQAIAPVA